MPQLMPGDQAVFGVVPDQDDERGLHPESGFDLLRIHHEAGVSCDRNHFAIGVRQLGRDCARHRDAHRGKSVRNNASVGSLGLVHARHPHLVSPDVRDRDVLRAQGFAQIPDDLLRLDRKGDVLGVFRAIFRDGLAHGLERVHRLRFGTQGNTPKGGTQIAEGANRDDIVRIDFCGLHIDVNDRLVAVRVPHVRVVFDHVVADADHDIGLLEGEPRNVACLQADRSE